MSRIIAFAASNSQNSINRKLVQWVGDQLHDEVKLLDLNDYEMPIYSIDLENKDGIPKKAREFKAAINDADGLIISFAEHNGSYSTAFKNIYDWISRIEKPIWSDKVMLLMGTSPGQRGARLVLQTALNSFPHQGGNVVASFSLPRFRENFSEVGGILNPEMAAEFDQQLKTFTNALRKQAEEAKISA